MHAGEELVQMSVVASCAPQGGGAWLTGVGLGFCKDVNDYGQSFFCCSGLGVGRFGLLRVRATHAEVIKLPLPCH